MIQATEWLKMQQKSLFYRYLQDKQRLTTVICPLNYPLCNHQLSNQVTTSQSWLKDKTK